MSSRRKFLLGSGLGAAALFARPFQRQLMAAPGVPKRFLILYMPNCNVSSAWTPKGGRDVTRESGDATQFGFGSSYAALEPLKSKLVLVDGLHIKYNGDAHGGAILSHLTGGYTRNDDRLEKFERNNAAKPSIDQVLYENSPALKGTRVGSLHQAADTRVAPDARPASRLISYSSGFVRNLPETQPEQTFARMFGSLAPGSTPAARAVNLDRMRALDRSVLDFVKGDVQRLSQRLAAAEKAKLEQQLQGLRELELSLSEPVKAGANTVTLPTGLKGLMPNDNLNHKPMLDAQLGIVKAAFQLDVTRVATYMFASGNSSVSFGTFVPGLPKIGVHALAHQDMDAPGKYTKDLAAITTWYVNYTAEFIKQLDAIREVDGTTMLDNTLVALVSDISQWHDHEGVPVVLFGGRALGMKTGRCLKYPGRYTGDLWQAITPLFGVDPAKFGDPARGLIKGPLPELA